MPGLGTIANCAAIAAAGILGVLFGNRIKKRMQDTLMEANAVAVIFRNLDDDRKSRNWQHHRRNH